jgi:LysR family transcriptional regulator (chromosome initiation inhibitor)
MLDPRKSDAVMAVIDSGSFEQAAVLLRLTPSAVSQRVTALEGELGMPLIVRGKPCRATREGQHLIQYLRRSRLLDDEFQAELDARQTRQFNVTIAVNNDTLEAWLLPGLAQFLIEEHILLDIMLDDQDHTFTLLAQGLALAGVSSEPEAMRGCKVEALGAMRYRFLATPAFARRWFPDGLTREAARHAPLMQFDRKDALQADYLQRSLGLPQGSYPSHYVPATGAFLQAIRLGLGYGMVPELQFGELVRQGELVDLAPDAPTDVPLYWHAWRVQSPKMERLSEHVVAAGRRVLAPLPPCHG